MVSPHISYHYRASTVKLHDSLRGQAQCIRLDGIPREGSTPLSYRLLNVYLATGDNHHRRRANQIKRLDSIPNDLHLIMGGDFNFVESADDATDYSDYHKLKSGASNYWERLTHKHSLWEVPQDTHTHMTHNNGNPRTSRIDRFYITHSEADCCLYTPHAAIANTRHSILNTLSPDEAVRSLPHIGPHMPVSLKFHTTGGASKGRPYKLPPWITHTPAFQNIFIDMWQEKDDEDPFDQSQRFKRTARAAHRRFKQLHSDYISKRTDPLCALTAAVKILKIITSPTPNWEAATHLQDSHADLSAILTDRDSATNKMRSLISDLLREGSPGPALANNHRQADNRSQGSALFTNKNHNNPYTEHITHLLPSTKTPLIGLREHITDPLATDTPTQSKIIRRFWGGIFSRRPNAPSREKVDRYLDAYDKRIPPDKRPIFPSLAKVTEFLKKSKNTSCGPDGMPLALYRNLRIQAGPVIHSLIVALSLGKLPPREFNLGFLHIFPKDNSSTIERTRPITVNNSENRLLASIVADVIMEAVDAIADPRQKGFIKGRLGEDNIKQLTSMYYNKLNDHKQHFFLFIDTAKAFDSLDHGYLFAVLDKIGMPTWVVNIVKGLMHFARVRPALKGKQRQTIQILRGVKQGCPLSPLLFIIAYDPLLHRIGLVSGAIVWSFADDAVIANENLSDMHTVTKAIDLFSTISGFGVNRNKSTVLHVLKPTRADHEGLEALCWRDLKFSRQATYLGILMGHELTTIDIYEKAFQKFKSRTLSFSSALRHAAFHGRVYIFNTYILPLFSYITNYYILPHKELGKKVRHLISTNIISFNGGAYKYIHLITPTNHFGLARPLRDCWANNVASLACQFDFTTLIGDATAIIPGKEYLNDDGAEWNGLLVEDHIACAALDLVNHLTPPKNGQFDITPFDVTKYLYPKKRLRKICYQIALTAYDEDLREDLRRKLKSMDMCQNSSKHGNPENHFIDHGKNIFPKMIPQARDNHRKLIFNALATDRRLVHAIPQPHRGPIGNPYPCYLCGKEQDNATHIMSHCPPVSKARRIFGSRVAVLLKNDPKHVGLACKAVTHRPPSSDATSHNHTLARRTNATIIFNHTVWHIRHTYCKTIRTSDTPQQITSRLVNYATMIWNKCAPAHQRPSHDGTPPDPAILEPGKYGSAGNRTPEQKQAAADYGNHLIDSTPSSHHIAYTDGSAEQGGGGKAKQGHSGAGARLTLPLSRDGTRPTRDYSIALGTGTNNSAELYAIGLALEAFIQTSVPGDRLTVFSDSLFATLAIEHNATVNVHQTLVNAVRALYRKANSQDLQARIRWTPAHAGIAGNEAADSLAEEGTRRSALGRGLRPDAIAHNTKLGHFIFPRPPPVPHVIHHNPPPQP